MHFLGIAERFDYFMTGEHVRYERIAAVSKFVAYITMAIILFVIFK
jgi:hypothetical protein